MRIFLKLVIWAAIIYGAWWVWNHYDMEQWGKECWPEIKDVKIQECLKMPVKR
ncbi:MAG: hypothetical protein HY764_00050 [Candidatus Portnoybacteria bacterium]|nr:hypothetical protein [Candidatus Portnoybacteria bacterium]